MNIVFTEGELAVYSEKMVKWYNDRLMFVLEMIGGSGEFEWRSGDMREAIKKYLLEFDEKYPRPDWKTYL